MMMQIQEFLKMNLYHYGLGCIVRILCCFGGGLQSLNAFVLIVFVLAVTIVICVLCYQSINQFIRSKNWTQRPVGHYC